MVCKLYQFRSSRLEPLQIWWLPQVASKVSDNIITFTISQYGDLLLDDVEILSNFNLDNLQS